MSGELLLLPLALEVSGLSVLTINRLIMEGEGIVEESTRTIGRFRTSAELRAPE